MDARNRVAAIIGAGLIGRAWAIVFARAGWQVRLYSRRYDQGLAASGAAIEAIQTSLADMHDAGLLAEPPARIAARITPVATLADACLNATLVQENIVEDAAAKAALFAAIDALAPAEAILASSTSWLPASTFTETLPGRHRMLVAHPTNPPHLVPLVEICPAAWTDEETVTRALALYTSVGQQPVRVNREIDGFLLNRIQGAVLNEMLALFAEGIASAADLDRVMTHGLARRWSFIGPFETIDLNAPDGVLDYARRYGGSYARLAQSRGQNRGENVSVWSEETLQRLAAERRRALPADQLAARARWRDATLMAASAKPGDKQP